MHKFLYCELNGVILIYKHNSQFTGRLILKNMRMS